MRRPNGVLWLALLVAVLAFGCRPDPATPRGTAEHFLDAHYVRIDLHAFLALTDGVAREKVQEELRLTQGQVIDDSTRKPTIRYRLVEERPDGVETVRFLYKGTILVEDADRFERDWLLTVRRGQAGWRVTNYQEYGS